MSDGNRFALGYENYAFERPGDRVAITAGTVVAGDVSSLRSRQLAKRVTIEPSGAFVRIEWRGGTVAQPLSREIGAVALVNAQWESTGFARMFVTAWLAGVQVYSGLSEYPIDDLEEIELFTPNFVHILPSPVVADRVEARVAIGGLGDPNLTTGAIWVGPTWRPGPMAGLQEGWSVGQTDLGDVQFGDSGSAFPRARRVIRDLSGSLTPMTYTEAFGKPDDLAPTPPLDVQKLRALIGTTRLVWVMPRTVDNAGVVHNFGIYRLGFVGVCTQLGRIVKQPGDYYTWDGFTFREVQ